MSFRTRLTIAFLAATLLPLLTLMYLLRQDTRDRLTTEYEGRIHDVINIIEDDLDARQQDISSALNEIAKQIANDNQFRAALQSPRSTDRRYLVDYAPASLSLSNLSTLYIVSSNNVILSSGHFRNEYDRLDPGLVESLEATPESLALVEVRLPDTVIVTLSSMHRVNLGTNTVTLVGGTVVDARLTESLQRTPDVLVYMQLPGQDRDVAPYQSSISNELTFPYIPVDRTNLESASISVMHDTAGLTRLLERLDRWFLVAGLAAILGSFVLAWFFASRISKPIQDVSARARRLDLNHLNVNFHSSRKDEIGDLSRTLSTMTSRLRRSRNEVIAMERKAAIGDIARQVNHDIRNGLTPIRNIVRYLDESAGDGKGLQDAFQNRKETLESSIGYLYDLASNYARLSSTEELQPVDLQSLLAGLVDDARAAGSTRVTLRSGISDNNTFVMASPLSARRIFDNLLNNAIDSVQNTEGSVVIRIESSTEPGTIRVDIADQGEGIPADLQDTIFDDFYTTKDSGTGLGLSIVRRLVMDLNGTISVASEPGKGSTFSVTLPTMPISS